MKFAEILKRCKGQTILVNNSQERVLLEVEEDFIVLQGGNPQLRLTEFVPIAQIVRLIRADYVASGESSLSLDITVSGGDHSRSAAH